MGRTMKKAKKEFISELKEELKEEFVKAIGVDANLEKNLEEIKRHFEGNREKYDALSKQLLNAVFSSKLQGIHSATCRVKETESLLRKIVKKKAELSKVAPRNGGLQNEAEKYRTISGDDYYKVVTDLMGIRILIRYRQEWTLVDRWIREEFPTKYVSNWIKDYEPNPSNSFIAEKPKIYFKPADRILYEKVDKEKFELHESRAGYNSYHYIINYCGSYVEIQVRTILDEAWCECTHDVVYKGDRTNLRLSKLAQSMSEQMKAAEIITEILYDEMHPHRRPKSGEYEKEDQLEDGSITSIQTEEEKRFGAKIDKIVGKKIGA